MEPDAAREDLRAWRSAYPTDPFTADEPLRRVLRDALDERRLAALEQRAGAFAAEMVAVVAPAAARSEHRAHLPELARWGPDGQRTEAVEFDPAYERTGAAVWGSGLVALSSEPGRAYEQATLLYLLSAEGEAGHACPATCTIGLARALRRAADPEVRERFLPPLVTPDYPAAERASQFLTEVQGGSDVGANACRAEPAGDGTWRIGGEKWFCSVADADQFLVTARVPGRPPGTRGLGCFVVPRELGGAPNGFSLRRLKEKLGTRGLASGEIDFDGAIAWPVGPVEQGFRTAVGIVLNTSRWLTAVGASGMMRRAVVEATGYAQHRRAFGEPIVTFPSTRATLASMRAEWLTALHLTFDLTALEDRVDAGTADEGDRLLHRFLVNAVKFTTSTAATDVVRSGIEVLGGNGTIEDFSVLPRLYRDAIVYESWEGTHNVLVAQVLNDLRRLPILDVLEDHIANATSTAPAGLDDAVRLALADARRAVDDPDFGAVHFRSVLTRLTVGLGAGLLGAHHPAAAAHVVRERLDGADAPEHDPGFQGRVDAVLSG